MQGKPQLFRLSHEIIECYDESSAKATYESMVEAGIAHDPFSFYHIELTTTFLSKFAYFLVGKDSSQAKDFGRLLDGNVSPGQQKTWLFEYLRDETTKEYILKMYVRMPHTNWVPLNGIPMDVLPNAMYSGLKHVGGLLRLFLMVVLATKNVDKKVVVNSKRSVSPRQKKDAATYESTITLKIGKITETYISEGGDGRNVRPHLRRGHIRTQRYGAGRTESKKIFIQPVFVNADEAWVDAQRTYKVVA